MSTFFRIIEYKDIEATNDPGELITYQNDLYFEIDNIDLVTSTLNRNYIASLANITLFPPVMKSWPYFFDGKWVHDGLNFISRGEEIFRDSFLWYKSLPRDLIFGDLKLPKRSNHINRTALYIETVSDHFGHAIVENFSRLWPLSNSSLKKVFQSLLLVGFGKNGLQKRHARLPAWLIQFYHSLDIDPHSQIYIVNEPTTFKKLIIPERISPYKMTNGAGYSNTMRMIGRNIMSTSTAIANKKKIFLSRSKLPPGRRDLINKSDLALENAFLNSNFEIIHSQLLPLADQINMINHATHIGGAIGSQLHLLSLSSNPLTNLYKVSPANFIENTDHEIGRFRLGRVFDYICSDLIDGANKKNANTMQWEISSREILDIESWLASNH